MSTVKQAWVAALAVVGQAAAQRHPPQWSGINQKMSPDYSPWMFQYPLPIAPQAQPVYSTNVNGSQPVQYYELTVDKFQQQVYPDLGPANLAGYNGMPTGPTFRVPVGTESIVRLTNNNDLSSAMHLHGAWTRAPWDGWADDYIQPGQFKDYYYSGSQNARTLWYHDHANGHTSVDAYYGQNGVHIIYDPAEDSLGLPSGKYDVPLVIIDKIYQGNGDLVSPADQTINFIGDIIHVNGQPFPYFEVEPRMYRLRFVNTALSRPFELYFADESMTYQNMQVVGSDGGLFGSPITTDTLSLSMGERYEVVFDFANYKGQNVTLGNMFQIPDIANYNHTDMVMRFVVGDTVTDMSNNNVPSTLVDQSSLVQNPGPDSTVDHVFNFQRDNNEWTINGVTFNDTASRVLARPPMGSVENWKLVYGAGPGVHPVHIHLIDFKIVSRSGPRGVLPYESAGLKDVVLLQPGETVNVVAKYGPWNGLYQWHCHNLIHEDHEMMDAMNVTALADLGYDLEDVLTYDDPMDPRYLAKDVDSQYQSTDYIQNTLIPSLVNSGAYRKLDELISAESSIAANPNPEQSTPAPAPTAYGRHRVRDAPAADVTAA